MFLIQSQIKSSNKIFLFAAKPKNWAFRQFIKAAKVPGDQSWGAVGRGTALILHVPRYTCPLHSYIALVKAAPSLQDSMCVCVCVAVRSQALRLNFISSSIGSRSSKFNQGAFGYKIWSYNGSFITFSTSWIFYFHWAGFLWLRNNATLFRVQLRSL